MKKIHTSVVIPTFNGVLLLKQFLPSVLEQLREGDELIIVDDASTDDTMSWLRHKYFLTQSSDQVATPTHSTLFSGKISTGVLRVLQLHKNSRFAKAVNFGVSIAQNECILLLNNDVELEKGAIKTLLGHFSDPAVFAVGAAEYVSRTQKKKPAGKNKLWFEDGLYQHSGVSPQELLPGDTAWVSGGSGMFSREKWSALEGLDADFYPAYWEDVDLSFRARKNDWKVLFDPEAVVYHHHETTNSVAFGDKKIQKISWKNSDVFTWKNGTAWQKILFLLWRPVWIWRRFTV
jgi:GT2 family glycosyltransferase